MGEQLHDPEVYAKCILFSILICFDSERQTFCISDSGVASVRLSYCFFDQSKPWTRISDRIRETLHWTQSSQEHVEFTLTILSLNPSSRTASRFCEISWSQFGWLCLICSCLHSRRKKCRVFIRVFAACKHCTGHGLQSVSDTGEFACSILAGVMN